MVTHDLVRDVQGDFKYNLQNGASAQVIVAELREAYRPVLYDPDAKAAFTMALAYEAWKNGQLYPELRDSALDHIAIEMSDAPSQARQAELARLSETLCSVQNCAVTRTPTSFWLKTQRVFQRGLSAVGMH